MRLDVSTGQPSWMAEAACLGMDPDLFFTQLGGNCREAREVCAGCEVRVECLEYALANHEDYGVWGGLSERERRKIHKRRRRLVA